MIGKRFQISGMTVEVIADEGAKWKLLNHTTGEPFLLDKSYLKKSIKLGKAEEVLVSDDESLPGS